MDRVPFVAFFILSECELQPLSLGIKRALKYFFGAFGQAKQNSFGMKCPAHFQNAAADTNTESKTNIVAPVYSLTSLHDHWSFHFVAPRFRGASTARGASALVHATRNRRRTDLSSMARQRHTTFII